MNPAYDDELEGSVRRSSEEQKISADMESDEQLGTENEEALDNNDRNQQQQEQQSNQRDEAYESSLLAMPTTPHRNGNSRSDLMYTSPSVREESTTDDDGVLVPSTPFSPRPTRRDGNASMYDDREEFPPTPQTAQTRTSRNNAVSMNRMTQRMIQMEDVPMTPQSQTTMGNSLSGYVSFLGDWGSREQRQRNVQPVMMGSAGGESVNDADTMGMSRSQVNDNTLGNPQEEEERDRIDEDEDNDPDALGTPSNPDGLMLIRGTNIHVRTAAKAFKNFIRTFVSVDESQRILKRRIRERRRASTSHDDEDTMNDNISDDSESSEDDRRITVPFYMDKLRSILLRIRSSQANHDEVVDDAAHSSVAIASTAFIDLNTEHLYYHSPKCRALYYQLISFPTEVVPLMDIVIGRELGELLKKLHEEKLRSAHLEQYQLLHPLSVPVPRTQVRPYYLKDLSHMRSLDPNAIDNLLSIRGMVVRISPIIPDLKVAHFECSICANAETITLANGRINEPTLCQICNVRNGFCLIHNRCIFADKQMVRIQETPDEVPAGETPASIVLFAFDDLVDAVRPGDRVEVTGILRAQPRRLHPKISKLKSVYRTYLDVIHFRMISGGNMHIASSGHTSLSQNGVNGEPLNKPGITSTVTNEDESKTDEGNKNKGFSVENIGHLLSAARIALLKDTARDPDIYERLVQSLAPSIWGLDDVKKGVLCMLFGGNSKRVKRGTNDSRKAAAKKRRNSYEDDEMNSDKEVDDDETNKESKLGKRGDINILLCGDPGTSKSQLLSYVHGLSPRGVYTSGKGSSAVGLTASVVRDPETRELVLESGALVLSDLGVCCIDEFDKMSDTTRAILHEAMEQQTVSIAKAGIIATLNARTSILASANPVESRYNPQLSVVENIKLPPTLLSRFDLIYLILDAPNVDNDRRLAQHLVGLYYDNPDVVQPPLDHGLLRDYISYARDYIHPELSDEATEDLKRAYLDMRRLGASGGGNGTRTISATPRQLESLVRLSEALAKMRYSSVVSRPDVKEAVRLMRVATQAAATDPRTGRIDMDMITTGRTITHREMEETLNSSLKEIFAEKRGNRMAVGDVRRQLSELMNLTDINPDEIVDALKRVEADGFIQFNERAQTIYVRA